MILRVLAAAWLAALLLGVAGAASVAGIGAAVTAVEPPSVLAMLDVALVGTLVGVVAGVPFLLARPKVRTGASWVGALWGGLVFAAVVVLLPPAGRLLFVALEAEARAVAVGVFALLFVGWGFAVDRLGARFLGYGGPERKIELHSSCTRAEPKSPS